MKKKILIISLLMIVLLILLNTTVNANVTASDATVESGGDVTINITSSETVYAYKISLISAGGLTFSSATSTSGQVNGTTSNGATASGVTSLATYKFKAPTVTTTTKYVVSFSISISTDGVEYQDAVTRSATITVSAPASTTNTSSSNTNTSSSNSNTSGTTTTTTTKSSDATLKSITVGNKTYSSPNTDITVSSVSASTSTIAISAIANSSKATVSGTGTKDLVTGTNKFTLTVTAEDGTTKSYVIRISRLAEESTTPNVIDETVEETNNEEEETEENTLRLSALTIQGVTLIPTFSSDVFEYTAYITDDEELQIDAISNIEDAIMEITGNTDLVEGENIVTITLTKDDIITEYKVIVNKNPIIEEEAETEEEEESENQNTIGFIGTIKNWWNGSGPMTVISTAILILLGGAIIFAILAYRYTKNVNQVSRHAEMDYNQEDEADVEGFDDFDDEQM